MEHNPAATRVLVIDDEEGIRVGSERILTRMDCDVTLASQGEQGLNLLAKVRPAIILLDMKMPGMDGMEVLGRIREIDDSILVIVITGYATVETAIEAMKKGAYDFVPKPFEPDQLRIVVNRALEKLRLQQKTAKLVSERRRTLSDLGTEKSRIHTILASLPNGVIVTNADGRVVLMNPAFKQHLNLDAQLHAGGQIRDYIQDQGLCDLVLDISKGKYIDYEEIPTYEFAVSDEKFMVARGRPVLGDQHECLGAVVTLVDFTAMKVIDRLKSEFVAKVSHELRSPLSTIHEQLAHVLTDMVDEASQDGQQILSRAKEKTQGLINLIGDLLDLSRIEAGAVCETPKKVDLSDLLKGIVAFLKTKADGKKQQLQLEIAQAPLPHLTADPLALESIFGNLITNAIHYTPEGGRVRVTAEATGISILVKVIDNGFGMEAKHLEKIFERFYRVKTAKTRYITGTGLGLPIVKGLVEGMGGFISVESTPTEGSTFTVSIPVG